MEVSLLTINCWGLWLVSRHRQQRMAALAAFLRCAPCSARPLQCSLHLAGHGGMHLLSQVV